MTILHSSEEAIRTHKSDSDNPVPGSDPGHPGSGVVDTRTLQQHLMAALHRGDQASWLLAAIAIASARTGTPAQLLAADRALTAAGIDLTFALTGMDPAGVAAQAAAPV